MCDLSTCVDIDRTDCVKQKFQNSLYITRSSPVALTADLHTMYGIAIHTVTVGCNSRGQHEYLLIYSLKLVCFG